MNIQMKIVSVIFTCKFTVVALKLTWRVRLLIWWLTIWVGSIRFYCIRGFRLDYDFCRCWNFKVLSTSHVSVSRAKHRTNQLWSGVFIWWWSDSTASSGWTMTSAAAEASRLGAVGLPCFCQQAAAKHRTTLSEPGVQRPGRLGRIGNNHQSVTTWIRSMLCTPSVSFAPRSKWPVAHRTAATG